MEGTFYYVKNFCEERENLFKIASQKFNIYIYPFDKKCDLGRIIYKAPPKMYLCINCGRIWMYEKKEFTSTQQDSPLKRLFLSQQKHYANCRGAGI